MLVWSWSTILSGWIDVLTKAYLNNIKSDATKNALPIETKKVE